MTSHVIHLGDCLDPVSGLASLPDKSIDHCLCDPPYEAEAHTLQRRVKRGGGVMEVEPLSFSAMTPEGRAEVARQLARVSRRWVVAFCQVEAALLWKQALEAGGATYKRTGVWVKPDGMPQYSGDRPGMGYESIVIAHAPGRSTWNGGGKHGVWTFNKIGEHDRERTGHETQKPLALMEALVRDFTDAGETILDPFAGSGTTGVACKRLGRSFIGWERDPKYHAIAEKRIASAREQLGLFGGAPAGPAPKQASLLTGTEGR
jgi:site-specific DNA-methyltransferase (adenine-specific)